MTAVVKQADQQVVLLIQGQMIELGSLQGLWTERQYLRLTNYQRKLIEFTDGDIEVLPTPTRKHRLFHVFYF